MKLKITLVRGSNAPEIDLAVTADAGSTVGEVAEQLLARDPYLGGAPLSITDPTLQVVTTTGPGEVMARAAELAEAPLGSGARVSVVSATGAAPTARSARPEAVVIVVSGPDAGRKVELGRGTHVIGRDSSSAVLLSDPLVSKQHARIDLLGTGGRLVDLNSANGVLVEGEPVSRWDIEHGREFMIGDSVLAIELLGDAARDDDDGTYRPVMFVRSPRVEPRYPGEEYPGPDLPREQDSQPFPWLALVAPVVMGLVLYLITQSPTSLVFVALSPLLLVGNFISARANRRRKAKLDAQKFDEQLARLDRTLHDEIAREQIQRLKEVASTDDIVASARQLHDLLWTRRPEHWSFLSVRLGRARQRSRNSVVLAGAESALPDYLERANQVVERHKNVDDVPVFESLGFAGAIGIAGSSTEAADVARAVIAQICGLHSTTEVVIAAIVGGASV
ncbi:MAG: FHA domain-containing protein, partial [Microcella pacifica]